MKKISLDDITIRTTLRPGDIGYIIYMHGDYYGKNYQYGIEFETYVAQGLVEFYNQYDPERNCVWICEHEGRVVGFLLLMDRGEQAQLRYFIIDQAYHGIGLGKLLMEKYMSFYLEKKFKGSFLWTTHELPAAAS